MPLKPSYLLLVGAGGIVAYSGVKGKGIGSAIRQVISGHSPATAQPGTQIPGAGGASTVPGGSAPAGNTGAANAGAKANQALARLSVAISHPSWAVGQQWKDWVSLWNQESGWSNTALNGGSGAFGLAQALGHGTPGTAGKYGDAYGANYGLSTASARAANNGRALPQLQWGIGYIAATYGSPSAAWAHEVANNWY